jgi:Raf kinase inhibitor-like YbhB/YbcL family protein
MKLRSSAFAHEAEIPRDYTADGADRAPPLAWDDAPAGTKSFALIMDDPDAPDPKAPKMTWVHWLVYNLPPDARALPEGGQLPAGARQGINDWKRAGYGGPEPPVGRHRYFFKLFALDVELPDLGSPTKPTLEQAMEGHVLGRAELMGTYQKQR